MGLFDGVQNFTPAFTGQQLALEAGSRIAAGFQRGVNNKNTSRQLDLQEQKFQEEQAENEMTRWRLQEFQNYTTGGEVPEGSVGKANHIISRLTEDPSWLADPRTSAAANSVFAAASRVVSMNLQMERVKNSSVTAKTEQSLLAQQLKMAGEVAQANPDSVASMYAKDENGVMPISDVRNFSKIAGLHKQFAVKDNGVDPMDVRLIEKEDEYRRTGQIEKANLLRSILTEKAREKGRVVAEPRPFTVTTEEGDAKVTQRLTAEEYSNRPINDEETVTMLEQYRSAKSNADSGNERPGPDAISPMATYRSKADNLKAKLREKGVDADTGKRISDKKRLRVRGPGGATGTVEEGDKLPEGWSFE